MNRIILVCLFLLSTSSVALSEGIINSDGVVQEMCVRIKQNDGIALYKGYLFTTSYEREMDIGTVIVENLIGFEMNEMSNFFYRKFCNKYQYTTGPYTVSININGKNQIYRGTYSYRPWVDIKID